MNCVSQIWLKIFKVKESFFDLKCAIRPKQQNAARNIKIYKMTGWKSSLVCTNIATRIPVWSLYLVHTSNWISWTTLFKKYFAFQFISRTYKHIGLLTVEAYLVDKFNQLSVTFALKYSIKHMAFFLDKKLITI